MVASCCPWPLYTIRRNEQQGRCVLVIRTVLNGGRAKHYNRLLGTVESLLQKRLKYRQSKHVVKDFQGLVNLLSATVLTRGSVNLLLTHHFYLLMFFWGKSCHPSQQIAALQNSRSGQHLPESRENMLSPTRACLLWCDAKQLHGS